MFKRVLPILLCLALVLSGCKGTDGGANDEGGATPVPTQGGQVVPDPPPAPSSTPLPTAPPVDGGDEPASQLPNPLVESSADEIREQLGVFIIAPDGATDDKYYILAGDTAQCDFMMNGVSCTLRIAKTSSFEDLSGMFVDFATQADLLWVDYPYHVAYNEGEQGVVSWYDELMGCSYTVSVDANASEAFLTDLAMGLIPAS